MGERGKTRKTIDAERETPKPLKSKGLASFPQERTKVKSQFYQNLTFLYQNLTFAQKSKILARRQKMRKPLRERKVEKTEEKSKGQKVSE